MRIGINASFLRKPATGIGQVTINFLHILGDLCQEAPRLKDAEIFVYAEEDFDLEMPARFHKRIFLPLWRRDDLIRKLWWEKYLLPAKANGDGCDLFISLYQSPTTIKYIGMKHIMVVHDMIPSLFPEYLDTMRKRLYQSDTEKGICGATHLVTVSEHTRTDLIERFNVKEKRISHAYIDIDPLFKKDVSDDDIERMMKKYTIEDGYIYAGGGLEIRKNADGLLRAYKKLFALHKSKNLTDQSGTKITFPKLVISGKLMPQLAPLIIDVQKLVKELHLEEHVRILGFVPQEDLPALYKAASFFCFPSHYEGFGMPVLEAMNIGTPVLTSDNSSLREVGGNAVMYCDDNDIDDISAKMELLLKDQELRVEMQEKGLVQAENFSWKSFVREVIDVQ